MDQATNLAQDFGEFVIDVIRYARAGDWQAIEKLVYEGAIVAGGNILANVVEALLYLVILFTIYRLVDRALARIFDHSSRIDAGVQGLLMKSFRVIAITFIIAMVLSSLGVNVTALVAGLSIAGIAVGFAARDSLENFIAGVTILMDKPFKVGDYIVIKDHYGQVHEITLRSTRIRSVRNEVLVLPNTEMITQEVVNHTKQNTLRIDIEFGIAYKEYPQEAREAVLPILEDDDRILTRPEPSVVVTGMADSAVTMTLRFFIREPSEEVPMRWEYTEKVREALREADIEIPFPHRQLFLDEARGLHDSTLFNKQENGTSTNPSAEEPDA
ncbi:mechanosensitive ion channel protein MscS [Longibacter salinarum]|uniref:Mechanosensitive ion channel protein MscS n=2 Tax=Longibacter salinarum TaxID=1850348 RepID=A0A2A8CWJ3_9BACT|nr:mechanosensitive ion channel protein MscS [Longibacter salinarum]